MRAPVGGDDACEPAAVRCDNARQAATAGAKLKRYQRRTVAELVCSSDCCAVFAQVAGERDCAAPHRAAQPRAELFLDHHTQASEAKAAAPNAVVSGGVHPLVVAAHGAAERATGGAALIASSVAMGHSDINARGVGARKVGCGQLTALRRKLPWTLLSTFER